MKVKVRAKYLRVKPVEWLGGNVAPSSHTTDACHINFARSIPSQQTAGYHCRWPENRYGYGFSTEFERGPGVSNDAPPQTPLSSHA